MLKTEFSKLMGTPQTDEEYTTANAVYMMHELEQICSTKDVFCKMWKMYLKDEMFMAVVNNALTTGTKLYNTEQEKNALEARVQEMQKQIDELEDEREYATIEEVMKTIKYRLVRIEGSEKEVVADFQKLEHARIYLVTMAQNKSYKTEVDFSLIGTCSAVYLRYIGCEQLEHSLFIEEVNCNN